MSTNEIFTTIFSVCSLVISIFAVFYSRKDKVLLMEGTNSLTKFINATRLTLSWSNNTDKNITELSMLCIFFDENLCEISNEKVDDLFLNPICKNSEFHYYFPIKEGIKYIRIKFNGHYSSVIPFVTRKMNQVLWYSIVPVVFDPASGNVLEFKIYTTYKKEIAHLQLKNESLINNYDKEFQRKYN